MNLPDDAVARLLQGALRQPALAEQSMERLRMALENERQAQLLRSQRARTRRWTGLLAACLCAVAVLGWWSLGLSAPVIGTVVPEYTAGLVVSGPRGLLRAALGQQTLRAGQSVEARDNTALRLAGGGSLRLKAGSALTFIAVGELELRRGAVYVDFDPALARTALAIRTPHGVIRHLGTQYEVALLPAQLRLRVREGVVEVQGYTVARAQAGEQLTMDSSGAQQRHAIARHGADWAWVESLAGDFAAEGRNVGQLLHWVARETGRRIDFADEHVEQLVGQTILHGSIRGLAPDVALRAILATTTLAADVRGEVIAVRSAAQVGAPLP
jgi:ferric-dicitrate binding protein FerR (iron transport regulator)